MRPRIFWQPLTPGTAIATNLGETIVQCRCLWRQDGEIRPFWRTRDLVQQTELIRYQEYVEFLAHRYSRRYQRPLIRCEYYFE